jgi:hypothetical protein
MRAILRTAIWFVIVAGVLWLLAFGPGLCQAQYCNQGGSCSVYGQRGQPVQQAPRLVQPIQPDWDAWRESLAKDERFRGPAGPQGPPGPVATVDHAMIVERAAERVYEPLRQKLETDVAAAVVAQIRVPDVEPITRRLDSVEARHTSVSTTIDTTVSDIATIHEQVSKLAKQTGTDVQRIDGLLLALQGSASWVPYLAGGGPVGLGLGVGLTALGWYLRRRRAGGREPADGRESGDSTGGLTPSRSPGDRSPGDRSPEPRTSCRCTESIAALDRRAAAIEARVQSLQRTVSDLRTVPINPASLVEPPQPVNDPIVVQQTVTKPSTYVEVEKDPRQLVALQQAMDEYVRRHPGARQTVETIQGFAKQFEAGQPRR